MRRILEFFKNNKIFVIIVILAFLGSFLFNLLLPNLPQAIDPKTKILFKADSSCFQKGFDSSYNTILINLLQEREATSNNSIASSESVKMQSRMFYCVILAGLVSLLFTRKKKNKKLLVFILLGMIPLMYVIDVHQQDLIRRNESVIKITSKAINQLVNPCNDTVYVLKDDLTIEYEKATEPWGRWWRKAYTAYHPDLPQYIYYIVPLVLILLYRRHLKWSMLSKKALKSDTLTGSIKALLDEYKKAIDELINVIKPLNGNQLSLVVDNDTKDIECKSIQTVLTHTVSSGYSYSVYIENSMGINSTRPKELIFNNVNQYIDRLNTMFEYCENIFNKNPDPAIEQTDNSKKINTKWGQQYDIEQLLEHAIVHVLRHRRQIENFIKRQNEQTY